MPTLAPAHTEIDREAFVTTSPSGLEAACQSNLRSATVLLDHVRTRQSDLDALVHRILAHWHDYLELRFKLLGVAAEGTGKTHDLAVLWARVRARIVDRSEQRCLDEHIADLVTLDPDAMALRYTRELASDRKIPAWLRNLDYIELAYVVMEVSTILEAAHARSDLPRGTESVNSNGMA